MNIKTILLDLDGVLNTYTGDYDENVIPEIKCGAKDFLERISKNYKIKIFTTRNKNLVFKWLADNKIEQYICDVTNIKEPAWIYIDDRAICFNGDYSTLYEDIINFKVWYKKE